MASMAYIKDIQKIESTNYFKDTSNGNLPLAKVVNRVRFPVGAGLPCKILPGSTVTCH